MAKHIHHINLNHDDNRPKNLVRISEEHHRYLHRQVAVLFNMLINDGIIVFDGYDYHINLPKLEKIQLSIKEVRQ